MRAGRDFALGASVRKLRLPGVKFACSSSTNQPCDETKRERRELEKLSASNLCSHCSAQRVLRATGTLWIFAVF